MFVQGFEGSWFDHPFWRTKFVLAQEKDLLKVRGSSVRAVIIDETKGAPLRTPDPRPGPPVQFRAALRPTGTISAPKSANFATSYTRALKLFGRSRKAVTGMYDDVRLGKAIKAEKLVPLVDEITQSIDSNPRAFISIAQLKSAHEYIYMHSVAVCALMINLARELRFSEAAVRDAGMAGLLHDIGKAVMPTTILDKPGPLEDDEFELIKTHTVRGRELLARSSGVSHHALDVCLRHHEKYDGSGYPDGLAGDRLSLFARMSALCDVYDAVTSERAYKRPWTPTEAVSSMRSWTGHFDPDMTELFLKSVGIYPVGALVKLRSGLTAMVTGENPEDPTRPPMISVPHSLRLDPRDQEIVGMASAEAEKLEAWENQRTALVRRFRS